MKTRPKLVIAKVKTNDMLEADFKALYVSTTLDAMQEPNLKSVICQTTKKDLLPSMDSISKQRVLHNLFAQCQQ
jgi:hypothetical protein